MQTRKACCVFRRFNQVRNPNRSGDIPVQSHVRLGVFSENPRKQPDAKVFRHVFREFECCIHRLIYLKVLPQCTVRSKMFLLYKLHARIVHHSFTMFCKDFVRQIIFCKPSFHIQVDIALSCLTRWLPAYGIFVLRFQPKKQQFSVALPTP